MKKLTSLLLAAAMLTGRTLYRSKFPYAVSMKEYLRSMGKLRTVEADKYIVAHKGIYDEILPMIDLEMQFLTERMLELLDLVGEASAPKELTAKICKTYDVHTESVRTLAYFEQASQTYLNYLHGEGFLDALAEEGRIVYRPTELAKNRKKKTELPKTGLFR